MGCNRLTDALLVVGLALLLGSGCDGAGVCDPECSPAERCLGGRCRVRCANDADCPPNTLCFEGYCEEGNYRPGGGGGDFTRPPRGDTNTGPAQCGDGVRNGNEVCDGDDLGIAVDCGSLGYNGTSITCLPSCQHYDLSACNFQGGSCNGVKANGGEQCDGTDLRDETCQTLGYSDGTLTCSAECTFDIGNCIP